MNNKLNKTTNVNMNENKLSKATNEVQDTNIKEIINYKLKEIIHTDSIKKDINEFKDINKATNVTSIQISKIKKKCYFCKKKLKIINYDCKCGGKFCEKHRLMQSHQCEYIQQNTIEKKKIIEKNNPKIELNKVINI